MRRTEKKGKLLNAAFERFNASNVRKSFNSVPSIVVLCDPWLCLSFFVTSLVEDKVTLAASLFVPLLEPRFSFVLRLLVGLEELQRLRLEAASSGEDTARSWSVAEEGAPHTAAFRFRRRRCAVRWAVGGKLRFLRVPFHISGA